MVDIGAPGRMTTLAALDLGTQVFGVGLAGGIAYLAGGAAGVLAVDVAEPNQPRQLGRLPLGGSVEWLIVRPPFAYALARGSGLTALTLATDGSMAVASQIEVKNPWSLAVTDDRIAVLKDDQLVSYDRSKPGHPRWLGRLDVDHTYSGDLAPYAGQVVLSQPHATGGPLLRRFDLGPDGPPVETARLATGVVPLGRLATAGDRLLAGFEEGGGLELLAADDGDFRRLGTLTLDALGVTGELAASSERLYTGKRSEVALIDLNRSPPRLSGFVTTGTLFDLAATGPYLYLATHPGLAIVDAGVPDQPRQAAFLDVGYDLRRLAVGGGIVTAITGPGSNTRILLFFDVTDPYRPQLLSRLELGRMFSCLALVPEEQLLYAGNKDGGLTVVDLTDPLHPYFDGQVEIGTKLRHLVATDRYLFGVSPLDGLVVLDRADPRRPRPLATLDFGGEARSLVVPGRQALLGYAHGIRWVDLSDPASPTVLATYRTARPVDEMALIGDTLWVSQGDDGVLKLQLEPWPE
jgi:hypothetical protein